MIGRRFWSFIFSSVCILFFASCEVTSIGAVEIDGRPAQIEIKENTQNGIMLYGLDVSINSEFVGTAKRIGKASGTALDSKIAFEPIETRYGEINLVQNISGSFAQVGINFDVFVDGEYAGNVQMSDAL